MVEFALCLPLLAILVFGTIDVGRVYQTWEQAKNAAREGAAFVARHPGAQGSVSGVCADPGNATWHAVHESLPFTITYSPSAAGCLTDPGALAGAGLGPGQPIRVTATTHFRPFTPLASVLFGANPAVSASVCVNIVGAAPSPTPCP
jgi:hypothetical protein